MDEANGPLFGQHDELFAAMGADAEQQLKDFVFEMTGTPVGGSSTMGGQSWGPVPHRTPDSHGYPMANSAMDNSLINTGMPQRNFFNESIPFDLQCNLDGTSAFFDNLVRAIPDDVLDGINGLDAIKRSLMGLPEKPSTQPAAILDTMHRLSTDNGTQEYLDSLSKPEAQPLELKPPDPAGWNGSSDPYAFHPSPVHKPDSAPLPLRGMDRNGGPVYSNGLADPSKSFNSLGMRSVNHEVTKSRQRFNSSNPMNHDAVPPNNANLQIDVMELLNRELSQPKMNAQLNTMDMMNRELSQNMLMKGLSPSVSADSAIHTPTASYESASPLSSGRTPLRSDDSISPLASCASPATSVRTPMRSDDCFSPGRIRRTPLRTDEAPSPRSVGRTPLRPDEVLSPAIRLSARTDEVPSPAARTAVRSDDVYSPSVRMPASPAAPSPRGIARTPLRPDEAPSPRSVSRTTPIRTDDALSPRGLSRIAARMDDAPSPKAMGRTSFRADDANSPKGPTWTPLRVDETGSPRTASRTPMRYDEVPSPWSQGRTPLRPDDSLSPRGSSPRGKPPTPLRAEDAASPRGSNLNPPGRSDDSVSPKAHRTPTHQDMSQLPPRAPFSPRTVRRREDEPETGRVPPVSAEPAPALPGPSGVAPAPTAAKPKKRRKTDAASVPAPKKRTNTKMPIYQSTVSEEQSGIKLKLKLTAMPPPKRRRRKVESEEGEKRGRKKRMPVSPGEQSPWGRDLPPELLSRIFKLVVNEEGCVPSLVRFSTVCRLWSSVSTRTELWQNVDLSSPYIKQKCKIDRYFRWLLENRIGPIRELNLNGWKFSNLPMVLSLIGAHCSDIESIGMSGWQGLHYEHLRSLLQDCPRLARIDLSDVSPESKGGNSATSPKSITYLTETMAARLTELTLSHNTLSCLPQIISSLAVNCPNLQVLDLSNIRRASHAEFALHIEELQVGCPQLRVLRITNSCITVAVVPFDQQAASPGFVALEELSIASHQGTESLRITSVMDDDCLERIVKTSHKLRLLDVRSCSRISESSLVRVPAWDIQHLFLSGCLVTRQPGSGLELIAQKWSHSLVEIDLAWTSVAEDLNAAIVALAERGADSPLRVVNLCGSAVEAAPIKTLLTKCPQLESLNLQSCRGLPRGVKRLYERHQLPELLELLQQSESSLEDT